MKNWIAALAVVMTIDGSTTTIINIPKDAWVSITPYVCVDYPQEAVQCSTPTVTIPEAPRASTGPVILRNGLDCYRIDSINSNGTPNPSAPFPWVQCP